MFYEFDRKTTTSPWSMTDMHCHKHYELYVLLEGERNVFIENNLYKISPMTIFFIPPFAMHKTEGQAFSRININFSSDYFSKTENEVFTKYLSRKMIVPNKVTVIKIQEIIDKLEEYNSQKNNVNHQVFTKCLIYELMLLLCNQATDEDKSITAPKVVQPIILTKILNYIQENLNEKLSLDAISQQFFISSSYLCKLFHKYFGISVTQTILNYRLTSACKLLSNTKKSINEIAEICGFSSANYFGLIFKKSIGLSPINYRKYKKN